MRREIEAALDSERNIVPLMFENFDFSTPAIASRLTGKLAALKRYNALRVPAEYFAEAMSRLRDKYLNVPLDAVLHPASNPARQSAKAQQAAASTAPVVERTQLAAEERFEQGFDAAAEQRAREKEVARRESVEQWARLNKGSAELREEEKGRRAREERAAKEEAQRFAAAEEARRTAEAEARRMSEEEARRKAEQEEAKRLADERARQKAEAEARRWREEEARRKAAEQEGRPGAGRPATPPPWKPLAVVGAVVGIGLLVFFALRERPEPRPTPAPPVVSTPAPPMSAPQPQPDATVKQAPQTTERPEERPAPAAPVASKPAPPVAVPKTQLEGEVAKSAPKAVTTFKPGATFRDCPQCPEMVVIPSGEFIMGSPEGERRPQIEPPQHKVAVARRFAVGKYEVTFDEWDACVAAGGCAQNPGDGGWGRGRQPVINVSWDDAQAYLSWLSKETGKPYRLLSDAEWEYAARAGTTTRYPWGDEPGTNHANFKGSGSQWSGKQASPVGSFHANQFGLHDMIGNLWEWVQDCAYNTLPSESGNCRRVARGGSFVGGPDVVRVTSRSGGVPSHRSAGYGFRVARTL